MKRPDFSNAACLGISPDLFFPDGNLGPLDLLQIAQAKAICAGCQVKPECRQWAETSWEGHGVWGQVSEQERLAGRPKTLPTLLPERDDYGIPNEGLIKIADGRIVYNFDDQMVLVDGNPATLRPTGYELLSFLGSEDHINRVQSLEVLIAYFRRYSTGGTHTDSNTIRNHVARLRNAIGDEVLSNPKNGAIRTVRGAGVIAVSSLAMTNDFEYALTN